MSSRQHKYPIRLVYDEVERRVYPVAHDTPLELFLHNIPLNAESSRGGYHVMLYDSLEEALAFVDAVSTLYVGAEYAAGAHPIWIGDKRCGVAVVEIEWMGGLTLFGDRRRSWRL